MMPAVNEEQHERVLVIGGPADRFEGLRSLLRLPKPAFIVGLDEIQVELLIDRLPLLASAKELMPVAATRRNADRRQHPCENQHEPSEIPVAGHCDPPQCCGKRETQLQSFLKADVLSVREQSDLNATSR